MSGAELVSLSASVATIIAAAAVVMTAAIYWRQLKAMTKARETESILAIMSYADNRELRQARYLMLEHSKTFQDLFSVPFSWESRRAVDDRLKQLSAGEVTVDSIDLSLNALNNVCYLIRYGYAPREAPDTLLKNSLLHSWGAFAQYVSYRRTRHGTFEGPSRYAEHFEWVVTKKYGALLPPV